jgi:hypothetical protein
MKDIEPDTFGPVSIGGHRWIHTTLADRLSGADLGRAGQNLGLACDPKVGLEIPFAGRTYRISGDGVSPLDGKPFPDATGSVLIQYVLTESGSRPAYRFVTLAELAGPLFKHGGYSGSALEQPIARRFRGRTRELVDRAASLGGREGGTGGLGSISLIVDLLPQIPLQLIFYDQDEEFPARATLLFDANATRIIEFEVVAVAVTLFVRALTRP